MKVFAFNTEEGSRGTEVLGHVNCCAYGNTKRISLPKLPRSLDTDWQVADHAEDRAGNPITATQFGQKAVCFCIGQLTCGTDTSWNWVVLIDA